MSDPGHQSLEELFLNSMTPPEQLLFDGWLLRFAPNDAKRARSVNAVYESWLSLGIKIGYCEHFYHDRGLSPLFRITSDEGQRELDDRLASRGYQRFDDALVQEATLAALDGSPPAGLQFEAVDIESFLRQSAALEGASDAVLAARLRRLGSSPLSSYCVLVRAGDRVIGAGMSMQERGWAGLFGIEVAVSFRGNGVATALCSHLMEQARQAGCTRAWLAVEAENTPALHVYKRLGFATLYSYWYREKPGALA